MLDQPDGSVKSKVLRIVRGSFGRCCKVSYASFDQRAGSRPVVRRRAASIESSYRECRTDKLANTKEMVTGKGGECVGGTRVA